MSSDSEGVFLTQSQFSRKSGNDTDSVLSDVLSLEEDENMAPNFNLKCEEFSDISEEGIEQISQEVDRVEKEQQRPRFATPLEEGDLGNILKSGICKNTETKTNWAMRVLQNWLKDRHDTSEKNAKIKHFGNDILQLPVHDLNDALSYFVVEVRNKDGNEYRPNTIYEIVIAIQHYFRTNGRFVNFLDDADFAGLRSVLDAKMKTLSRQGIGSDKKQAQVITPKQEEEMWKRGILGSDTPQKLLDTLLYEIGLNFALRAGQEHRNLRCGPLSQLKLKSDNDGRTFLEFTEDVSKTNAGGILHRKVDPKVTRAYQNTAVPDRCPVRIYQRYMSLR